MERVNAKKPTTERRPAASTVRKRAVAATPSVAQSLQQRLGNRATHQLVQRSRKPATQPLSPGTANETTTVQLASIPSPLRLSRPTDPAEREAEQVARKIVTMPESSLQPASTANKPPINKTVGGGHGATSASAQGAARTTSGPFPVTVPSRTGISGGNPLPTPIRRFMEPRFGANFGNVRIHTNQAAAKQSAQISAHAFTVGEHIHFGKDKFEPHSSSGKELIAHELTHTIQQGAVANRDTIHRSMLPVVSERTEVQAQRFSLPLPNARDFFADKAAIIPGFSMIALILGVNPISGRAVDRSAANLLRAAIDLMPGGALIRQALDSYGVFQRAGNFVEAQFAALRGLGTSIRDSVTQFLSSFSVGDLLDLPGLWERAKALVMGPIEQVKLFIGGLVDGIVTIVKDAILRPLGAFAQTTRGYPLLRSVLGQDPITDEHVPANAENLVGGFLKFINEEETWNKMQQAGAVPRIFAWFQGALATVIGMVSALPAQFLNVFNSLKIEDILNIPGIFLKLASVFGSFAAQFISWGAKAVWTLLEIIFDVVSPGALEYVKRTGAALKTIIRNPLPFVGQLIRAAKLGFMNFAGNFLTHLKAGLFDWLTGSLPGIYIPQAFSLSEIAKFAFSVLGLSWANIRLKLVKAVGEPAVKALETGFDLVVSLVRDGPIAAWEKIKEQLSNLKDTVIGGITDFIVDMVVKKAIPKLIAMFVPGAGFISAIMSIYDTVMVFVNKISQMVSVVRGFVDSIVAIAAGNVGAAAQRVEQSLATGLSLAINFFAGFAGLGKVADKVMGIFAKLRAPIDRALDWLVGWIAKAAKKVVAKVKQAGKSVLQAGLPKDPKERLKLGLDAAVMAVNRLSRSSLTAKAIKLVLLGIKIRFGLKELRAISIDGRWWIEAEVNPKQKGPTSREAPKVMTVGQAVSAIRKGSKEVTVRKESEARQVVNTVFPNIEERPGSAVGSVFNSQQQVSSLAAFRRDRSKLLMFHVDTSKYKLSEIRPAAEGELQRKEQEYAAINSEIIQLQNSNVHGSTSRLNERIEQQRSLAKYISSLRDYLKSFESRVPEYRQLEKDGILYGHEDPGNSHGKKPHINVEGTQIHGKGPGESSQYIEVVVYFDS